MNPLRSDTSASAHPLAQALTALLPEGAVLATPHARDAYRRSAMADQANDPLAVAFASSTAEAQAIMRLCRRYGAPVTPRGAGTNLTGGLATSAGAVVLCTGRMRRIWEFDPVAGTVRVEAGVRNLAVSEHTTPKGWFYAPDPSSRRSCSIGGNIATNSGGAACLRYGVTVNNIAEVTLVTPDGAVRRLGGGGYDEPGLDLASLICGSEGRLGVVTEAMLRLSPSPPRRAAMRLSFESSEAALATASSILDRGVAPSKFDFLDAEAARLCLEDAPCGGENDLGAAILIELAGAPAAVLDAMDAVDAAAEVVAFERRRAEAEDAAARLWAGRDRIYAAAARTGRYVATDAAVPLSQFDAMLGAVRDCAAAEGVRQATTLHLGDGTVHSFLFYDAPGERAAAHACADAIRRASLRLGGAISSEYGVGSTRRAQLQEQLSPTDLAVQERCVAALTGEADPALEPTVREIDAEALG